MQVWVDAACKTKSFLCFWTIQHKWGWTGTAWEEGPSSCCLQHLPVPRHWEPLWPLDQGISLFQNSGKKLHLATALTNCSARRETLPHCSLARSTCWQHSSVTSQGTGTGKPTNSSCSLYFPGEGEVLLIWRMADYDFSAIFSAPYTWDWLFQQWAAVESFLKSQFLEAQHSTPMDAGSSSPFLFQYYVQEYSKQNLKLLICNSLHSWLSKQQLPPTTLNCASLLPAYGFPPSPSAFRIKPILNPAHFERIR